eukprot:TRINITY_DN14329_c1_g3_i3.p1 TRINITY_DN14329_c1_g3~~TRINITY_DN14329_c1_g3_i3.p1  ORF type:complete len:259 (+),score=30.97 TRINITY_DN14329_c1_g3_i3:129-905(+)
MGQARVAGSYLYSEGYRLCVSGFTSSLKKTSLQAAFGEFGHIAQIETPKAGVAFVTYTDKRDAEDARKTMDGQTIDGRRVCVSKAEAKPVYRPQPSEMSNKNVLMTTQTEREIERETKAAYVVKDDQKRRGRSRRRSRSRSRTGPRSQGGRRSPSRSCNGGKRRSQPSRGWQSPSRSCSGGKRRSSRRSRRSPSRQTRSRSCSRSKKEKVARHGSSHSRSSRSRRRCGRSRSRSHSESRRKRRKRAASRSRGRRSGSR